MSKLRLLQAEFTHTSAFHIKEGVEGGGGGSSTTPHPSKDHSRALGRGVNSTSVKKAKLIPEPWGNSKDCSAALNIGIHVQLLKKNF